jgi:hypothetical protein
MMRIGKLMTGAALLGLAACGGAKDADEKSGASASQASAAAAATIDPGQWEIVIETSMPNMPKGVPGMAGAMPKITTSQCFTAKDLAENQGTAFTGKKDAKCSQEDFSVAGGKVRGKMVCEGEGGSGKVTMDIDGSYASDRYDVRTKMTKEGAGGMNMEMHATARRTGDCTAEKAAG